MKKIIFFLLSICLLQQLKAQTTSPTFNPTWAAQMQAVIDNAVANGEVKGVSVAVTFPGQGTFIGVGGISKEGVPITPDMQFGVGSHSKLFTVVLIMKLQELGKLSLNNPISSWLPSYPYINPAITIRQLLTHQSGIFDFETEIDPHENFHENMNMFVYGPDVFYTPQDVLAMIGSPHFAPGEKYFYSNTNHLLAAMIIEAATGKTYVENLHQYILDPLDLDSTFLAAYESPNGNVAHAWTRPLRLLPLAALWLLFLPNAPYIITDFKHLVPSASAPLWVDIVVIAAAASPWPRPRRPTSRPSAAAAVR